MILALDKKKVLELYEQGSHIWFHVYNSEGDNFLYEKWETPLLTNHAIEDLPMEALLPIEEMLDKFQLMEIKAGRVDIFEDI